ncbi:MAG: SDR family oxidoreductase [Streptosporangiaceae bacterium]
MACTRFPAGIVNAPQEAHEQQHIAGVGPTAPLDDLRVEDWEDMTDINVKGVLYGIAAALPVFRQQDCGQFVHTPSTAGLRIVPGQAVYAGTKNAVRAISEGLRQEAGGKLRVTTISPGFVWTDFADTTPDPGPEPKFSSAGGRLPLRRRPSPAPSRSRLISPPRWM